MPFIFPVLLLLHLQNSTELKNVLALILCCMVADRQLTSPQLQTQESILQMLWTQQKICVLLEFTASESVAVRVLSKLILSFLTVVLTDEQISSTFHHCSEDEKAVATTNLSSHTCGLILDSEELSTLTKHLKLCCFYPNVAVNCFSPNAFLRALCNLTNTSVVCCSCAKPLLLQNINTFRNSEMIPHIERALKTFLNFGAKNIRTAAIDLL